MSKRWCILGTRMGADISEPADTERRGALDDVFAPEDDQHPNAGLRLGEDAGPMVPLDADASGTILFEQGTDAYPGDELAPQLVMVGAAPNVALGLWRSLRRGDVDAVRRATRSGID